MPAVLYLVRHGAIIQVSGKSYIGQIDLPLSEEGVEQAWALREWLEPVRFSHLYSSDLSRAQRTCRIIAGSEWSIKSVPQCREISLGEWEGYTFHDIREQFPAAYAARGRDIENWRPPSGESFADCRSRALDALHEILRDAQENVLLVGHAGVNRVILCEALGIPLANLHSLGQDYGCVNIIDYSNQRTRVQLLNYVPSHTSSIAKTIAACRGRAASSRETYERSLSDLS